MQKQTGITSNTRGIFDALHYSSGKVETITSTSYMGGTALRTYDLETCMLSTGILEAGALEGNITIKVYWQASQTHGEPCEIRITDDDGYETTVYVPRRDGTLTAGSRITFNFDPLKSYEIEFWTNSNVMPGNSVILNYMRIDQLHTTANINASLYSNTADTEPISLNQQGVGGVTPISYNTAYTVVNFPIAYDTDCTPTVVLTLGTWYSQPLIFLNFGSAQPYGNFGAWLRFPSTTPAGFASADPVPFSWYAEGTKTPPISEADHTSAKFNYKN